MAVAKNRVLAGERVSRAAIDAAPTDEAAIRSAIDACDYDRAATIAFARAKARLPVDVMPILPGIELWTIACALIAIAPDRAGLLDLLEQRRFPGGTDSGEVEAIALYAAWRAGAARERLIPQVRRLSVRPMTAEGYALVAVVGAALDDANVTAAVKHIAGLAKERAAGITETDKTLARPLDQVIASLPAEVEIPDGGGFTVRTAKPVGRNDLCPCGSGLKYKKCCADKPVKSGSPIPGVSWDEFLTTAADQMTEEHVADLALRDLVRVAFEKLGKEARYAATTKLLDARAWSHAERLIDASADEDMRDRLIDHALRVGEVARARAHYDKSPHKEQWTIQFTDDPAALWREVTAAADKAMRSDDRVDAVELAYALLYKAPALGIVAARACIGAAKFDDADLLLEEVEDVRDALGLPPGDPAWNVLDSISEDEDDDSEEEAALKESLRESAAKADELERALAQTRAALEDARTPAVAALQRQVEPTRPLEDKIRELEALIRDGNAERRDLRRQLSAAATHAPDDAPKKKPVVEVDPDEAVAEPVATIARPVSIPRFERRALDAFSSVPASVASEAMRTVGTIAAGDLAAWRNVKQAKDMPVTVLMARVGIHHRLIMKSDGGSLDVLDLITREQLMTTLKRLRANL